MYDDTLNILSPVGLAVAIKDELIQVISDWSLANPDRVLLHVPMSAITHLATAGLERRVAVSAQLEGYVGAALSFEWGGNPPIPYPYELHAYILTPDGYIEILLHSPRLLKHPISTLADEVVRMMQTPARVVNVDETFTFAVPMAIIDYLERLGQQRRAQFRAALSRRLKAQGLSIHGGSPLAGDIEIRRNENR